MYRALVFPHTMYLGTSLIKLRAGVLSMTYSTQVHLLLPSTSRYIHVPLEVVPRYTYFGKKEPANSRISVYT